MDEVTVSDGPQSQWSIISVDEYNITILVVWKIVSIGTSVRDETQELKSFFNE